MRDRVAVEYAIDRKKKLVSYRQLMARKSTLLAAIMVLSAGTVTPSRRRTLMMIGFPSR
jgi:hypothetical protein